MSVKEIKMLVLLKHKVQDIMGDAATREKDKEEVVKCLACFSMGLN